MESYGAILKQTREAKGLIYDTISRDTSIAKFYLEALEKEDTAAFPGEPYLVGFLRNYALYLELDANRLVTLYKAKTLQEAPVPEGLIVHESPKYKTPKFIIAAAVLILAAAGILVYVFTSKESAEDPALADKNTNRTYELSEKPLQTRLYKGDQLVMSSNGSNVIITVAETRGSLVLETPVGKQSIDLSEELELNIDDDAEPDMIAYLSDIAPAEGDERRGAEVRIMLKDASYAAIEQTVESEILALDANAGIQNKTVIFEDTRAYPFTIVATLRGGTAFRYKTDNKEPVEDFLSSGEEVRITASNAVRLWIANGNAVKLQVVAGARSYDLGVSKAGAVVVEDIRWIKDVDGRYKVVIVDVD